MKTYELPTPDLAPEEVQKQIRTDSSNDPAHPYVNTGHFQHEAFSKAMSDAYETVTAPVKSMPLGTDETQDLDEQIAELNHVPGFASGDLKRSDKAAHDSIVEKLNTLYSQRWPKNVENTPETAQERAERSPAYREAKDELDKLMGLGYDPIELSPDTRPWETSGLKMQRLLAESNYAELTPMLDKNLRSLGAPANVLRMFKDFTGMGNVDPEIKSNITHELLSYYYKANKAKQSSRRS